MNAKEFASYLKGVRWSQTSDWHSALCPAHTDTRPSLSFGDGERRVGVRCFAGCNLTAILAALGLEKRNLYFDAEAPSRIVKVYQYRDEEGELLFETVRFEPKSFRQRRPDGHGGHIWNLTDTRRVLYRLNELQGRKCVAIPEGEKDVNLLRSLDFLAATTNPMGAGKWVDDYSSQLVEAGIELAIILPDNDPPGKDHAYTVAASCLHAGLQVKVVDLPGLPEKGDVSDWFDAGHRRGEFIGLVKRAPQVTLDQLPRQRSSSSPWAHAESAAEFIQKTEPTQVWLEPQLVAPGMITEIFGPRGIGKTHASHAVAVKLARKGVRVLLIDRDNGRSMLRSRLKLWGAGTPETATLKILSREKAPPLTDSEAWEKFPFADYDCVILDSLDAAAEGVGEKDSAKPSRAIAPLLDLAHRENGPAVLVLGNTVKSGVHSRGSGVVEDRADIVYEVRDVTGLVPSGKRDWWLELPPAGAADWAERASRRHGRKNFRLAFISTKSRLSEEPHPFILEIDLRTTLGSMRDVTVDVVKSGETAHVQAEEQRQTRLTTAADRLSEEVQRRAEMKKEPLLAEKDAVPFLQKLGLKRKVARALLEEGNGKRWKIKTLKTERGRPRILRPVSK